MRQLYWQGAGLVESDHGRDAREKVAGRTLLFDPSLGSDLPFVFDFMGIADPEQPAPPMDPAELNKKLRSYTRRYLQARSRREPAVLLAEDLHWWDAASETWLPAPIEAARATRTLLVGNFRPEYRARWGNLSSGPPIALEPLGAQASAELLDDLLGSDPSLDAIKRSIAERVAGNPFFAEEVVQSLVESGRLTGARGDRQLSGEVGEVRIPESVHAILAARIDQLDEEPKSLLQRAAVIGASFPRALLEPVSELGPELLDTALAALASREFVFETSLYPEIVYGFKHPLTQEVAYRSQLSEPRAAIHAAVARAIEQRDSDRLDERAALLAHHWENAREALPAARWHRRAAEQIAATNPPEAVRHWRSVRRLMAEAPDSEECDALELEACARILLLTLHTENANEEADELFERGRELGRRTGDSRTLGMMLVGKALYQMGGDAADARELIGEALALAKQCQDPALRLNALAGLMVLETYSGMPREILSAADRILVQKDDAARRSFLATRGYDPRLLAAVQSSNALIMLGRLRDAARDRQAVIERVLACDSTWTRAFSLNMLTTNLPLFPALFASLHVPEVSRLAPRVLETLEEAEELASPLVLINALLALAAVHLLEEDLDAAEEAYRRTGELVSKAPTFRMNRELLLAEATALCGDPQRALDLAGRALAFRAEFGGGGAYRCRAHLIAARAVLRLGGEGNFARARAEHDAAESLAAEIGAHGFAPLISLHRAELARAVGDPAEAERQQRQAERQFREMGALEAAEQLAREYRS